MACHMHLSAFTDPVGTLAAPFDQRGFFEREGGGDAYTLIAHTPARCREIRASGAR